MNDREKGVFIRDQLPAILWAILIFLGSSIPADEFPTLKIFQFDKAIHITIFFCFGLFIYRAFNLFWFAKTFSWSRALFTLLTVTVYGLLDEFHQQYVPGRTSDIWDATADTIGGILAVLLIYLFILRKRSRLDPKI
jgi:VanZ family protein